MVKALSSDEFLYQLDALYGKAKEKYSVYLTFKRVFDEKFKYKKNKKIRKQRVADRLNQIKEKDKFSILVRAKLRKERIHTIIPYEQVDKFHNHLVNILTLNFIRDEQVIQVSKKKMPIKKISKTKKRQMKRLRKLKNKNNDNQMKIDSINKI